MTLETFAEPAWTKEFAESGGYVAHFQLFCLYCNQLSRARSRSVAQQAFQHLEDFLRHAPMEHWSTSRACFNWISMSAQLKASSKGSKIPALIRLYPSWAEQAVERYRRGLRAQEVYATWGQPGTTRPQGFMDAKFLMNKFVEAGYLTEVPVAQFSCHGPGCGVVAVKGQKLKTCGSCLARRYCSSKCQKRAWAEHKHECDRLGIQKEAHTANIPKGVRPDKKNKKKKNKKKNKKKKNKKKKGRNALR
jgi:hypothetical protein